ncbi:MAG: Lrp/AsnC family transcriptional regulator [Culicoidibacterales bacterium]
MDEINKKIVEYLQENGRASWQEIGRDIHLTGQAVAARVQKMVDDGIIERFTITQEKQNKYFITVYMQNSNFEAFERFLNESSFIIEAHKVTGDGCYQLTGMSENNEDLDFFLEKLLHFGRYKVLSKLRKVK